MSDSDRADDPNRRLAERLHGIADPSMAVIIGNMIHEMIFELQVRESQGCAGGIPITLTDEERQAVERLCEATSDMIDDDKRAGGFHWQDDAAAVAVVRGLLERLK